MRHHHRHPTVTADPGNDRPSHRACGADSVVLVDYRNEVRDFLVSRRARITPDQADLPAYGGNRRVPGLRREEVALLAGVSIDYYTRLERQPERSIGERAGSTRRCAATKPHHLSDAVARLTCTSPTTKSAPSRSPTVHMCRLPSDRPSPITMRVCSGRVRRSGATHCLHRFGERALQRGPRR
jgi:hypothetical protein